MATETRANNVGFVEDGPAIVGFIKYISDPNNWRRVALFTAGLILLVIAFFRMTGDNKMSGATKAAIALAVTRKPPLRKVKVK